MSSNHQREWTIETRCGHHCDAFFCSPFLLCSSHREHLLTTPHLAFELQRAFPHSDLPSITTPTEKSHRASTPWNLSTLAIGHSSIFPNFFSSLAHWLFPFLLLHYNSFDFGARIPLVIVVVKTKIMGVGGSTTVTNHIFLYFDLKLKIHITLNKQDTSNKTGHIK
ncbi:hypothetical protein VIGAN_06270200 [Vigna angularis var. angularis]|uniref:Uncharacterized protein n=1 Tax=Vigna angularis var. angularis TaxID=157739 RepID=A0A0S3SEY1_PHAAN|nr:hypothetical protein VIGAN_06270200 [Vigna angularis var. angularis]